MGSFTSWDGSTVVECGYDYQGRRYMKKVTQNGMVASHERYLYRGHLQITALDMLNSRNVLRTLLWDPVEPVATRPLALVQDDVFYCYGIDFNKNVTEVFDREGAVASTYDYSPYGQVVSTGNLVQSAQWSSEMNDEELALVYYNYRYYNPADGRWINRDPIAEQGGWNLYGFVNNMILNKYDYLGNNDEFQEEKTEDTDVYELEYEGEVALEDGGLNPTSRTIKEEAEKIIGKRFPKLKPILDVIRIGVFEQGKLLTSVPDIFGLQITVFSEFECKCKDGIILNLLCSEEEWKWEKYILPKDFDIRSPLGTQYFNRSAPFPSGERIIVKAKEKYQNMVNDGKKKCDKFCKNKK